MKFLLPFITVYVLFLILVSMICMDRVWALPNHKTIEAEWAAVGLADSAPRSLAGPQDTSVRAETASPSVDD